MAYIRSFMKHFNSNSKLTLWKHRFFIEYNIIPNVIEDHIKWLLFLTHKVVLYIFFSLTLSMCSGFIKIPKGNQRAQKVTFMFKTFHSYQNLNLHFNRQFLSLFILLRVYFLLNNSLNCTYKADRVRQILFKYLIIWQKDIW